MVTNKNRKILNLIGTNGRIARIGIRWNRDLNKGEWQLWISIKK